MVLPAIHWRPVIWLAVAMLATSSGTRAAWAPNDAQQEALEAINTIRTKLGLPHYTMDERLCRAASAHSAYVDVLVKKGHDEVPGVPGFTGVSPSDRARAAGYPHDVSEVINYRLNIMGVTNTVRELFDAPYHRLFFLQRGRGEIGAGVYGKTLTIDFCVWPSEGTFVYPLDGEVAVPVSWARYENPDPRSIGHLPHQIGYPLYFHWESNPREEIIVSEATIKDGQGNPVNVFVNSPANDSQLTRWKSESLILPTKPLGPHTTYTVKVSARAKSGRDISREWKFTTGGREIADLRESQAEDALNVSFMVEPGKGNSAIARVINLDRAGQRSFTLKARNTRGDLLDSGRLRLDPSSQGSLVLNAKEPIQSVVLVPEGKMAGKDSVTHMLSARIGH